MEVVLQRQVARAGPERTVGPAVGDWLAIEPGGASPGPGALREILPRSGHVTRLRPSTEGVQVLAANVDLALLVSGLDDDLNLRRIERYLVLATDGGVRPVVVLNKVDVATDVERAVADVHAVAAGTRVLVTSALTGQGMAALRGTIEPGLTACLLGSSGVGKSTIVNALLGETRQAVRDAREDDGRGRHTTTRRELFALPGGGLLVDTPGLRTVGLTAERRGLDLAFADVVSLARRCRFGDCRHAGEPGCAVEAAVHRGALRAERLESHRKLEAERRWAETRLDVHARREAERRLGRTYRAAKTSLRAKRGEA
jgi:ribosome biogenesis GTPase